MVLTIVYKLFCKWLFVALFVHLLVGQVSAYKELFTARTIAYDLLNLNKYLFSCDSLKIIAGFTPAYVLARHYDKKVHHCFYDRHHHKNIHQFPCYISRLSSSILAGSIVTIAGLGFFAHDIRLRTTGYAFLLGLPLTGITKRIIKTTKADFCLRPRNGEFHRYKRAYGGFPSGHMMEMVYITTLVGLQLGPVWTLPFATSSAFLFVDFAIKNRHYISQLVAGAALGTLFGVAASKVVDQKISSLFTVNLMYKECPHIELSYTF